MKCDLLDNCMICPRKCGVNRNKKELGFCGQTGKITAAKAYLHAWEEPCISGKNGSGTVFFSGCNLQCVFCQNRQIATGEVSKEITKERLSEIFLELQDKKASNINLVTPTHFVPLIIPAIERARNEGLKIPVVYNSSGYELAETLKSLEGLIDIYLPDCKYYSDEIAIRYSNAPNYFNIAIAAIDEMLRQVGEPLFEIKRSTEDKKTEGGETSDSLNDKTISASLYNELMEDCEDDYLGPLMKKGVIIRHLVLPGQINDSKNVVERLLERYRDKVYLSIMNQFTPFGDLSKYPELKNKVEESDYEDLIDFAIDNGIENGFFQGEGTDMASFIPAFDYKGL
ncbi:radical SAM protein [Butyrivibrio sp. NC2002]|uniref:radical SAM protein n=1 Tax=Butyrivibrio sp. NC2002 TaxID=1410610 RepID=UPI002E8DFD21|nr:radical SAM protein [Butyrivibrio sp. NC2002]